ncbi:2-oxoacid:ferredoxin oxidoreductase subunit gamma [bacterium]|nr:MAG: 2-oxoacid:ferredoxin oxidoreductase subunit gamma [bacterium]
MKIEVRLVGEGGQGLILGGLILAEAAIRDGKNVAHTQTYGAAARGEISKSDVIISDETIYYPKVRQADILLALTQEAYDRYTKYLKEGAIIVVDEFYVKRYDKEKKVYALPLSDTAIKETGKVITVNMVSLGVISELTGVVSKESLKEAMLARIPKGTEEINLKALEAGFEMGRKAKEKG